MEKITTIFWDLGGVVLTNAWDHEQRVKVLNEFDITSEEHLNEFSDRHREVAASFESGKFSLLDYLNLTLFGMPKVFTHEQFKEKMFEQSRTLPGLEVLKQVSASGKYFLASLNNESLELNEYRIRHFKLDDHMNAFFSSCYLSLMKPNPEIYRAALNIAHRKASECLFIDDRAQNIESARRCGLNAIHYRDPEQLGKELDQFGVSI
jgi:putative hydrolase of the HAD superfamily